MPIRIAIDLTALLPETTGCDIYMQQLVRHLGVADQRNVYDIFVNVEDRNLLDGVLPENFSVIPLCFRPRACRLLFQQALLPAAILIRRADVVHSLSFLSPILRFSERHVVTVHDMTFFSMPENHIALRRSGAFKRLVLRSIETADTVVAPSAATREHIAEIVPGLPPNRIQVVPHGIGDEFCVRDAADTVRERKRLGLPDDYILAVGTIEPRKNLGRLIDSYLNLVRNNGIREHLVLVGRLGWGYHEILAKMETPELKGRVHRPGYVSAADLPWYYAGARVCAYPSLQEGFGFPPLEAMASGIPVVSSLSSSLTENLGGAAELVSPDDTVAITAALARLLTDSALHARTREAGLERAARFRWIETARKTVEIYEAIG